MKKEKKSIRTYLRTIIAKVFRDAVEEINKMFPTDADCRDEIFRICSVSMVCKKCGGTSFSHSHGAKQAKCNQCRKWRSVTAGNVIFDHMHEPRPILTALIATKNGVGYNAHMLHIACKTAYPCALNIHGKITSQAHDIMEENTVPVISSAFDDAICRRSFDTDARQHPSTEGQKELEKMMTPGDDIVQSRVREFYGTGKLNLEERAEPPHYEDEQVIYDLLADGPLTAEELIERTEIPGGKIVSSLMTLVSCDLIEPLPGGRFKRTIVLDDSMLNHSTETKGRIDHAVEMLRILFGGVSRKYMQRYVAAYWCFVGRTDAELHKLFERCRRQDGRPKMSRKTYVSPLILSFPTVFDEGKKRYAKYGVDDI